MPRVEVVQREVRVGLRIVDGETALRFYVAGGKAIIPVTQIEEQSSSCRQSEVGIQIEHAAKQVRVQSHADGRRGVNVAIAVNRHLVIARAGVDLRVAGCRDVRHGNDVVPLARADRQLTMHFEWSGVD